MAEEETAGTGANPCGERLAALRAAARRRRLDAVALFGEADIRALTGVACDSGCLLVEVKTGRVTFFTDFRYIPMAHRTAPWLETREVTRARGFAVSLKARAGGARRLGYEGSITAARYCELRKRFPGTAFVDISADMGELRAVKTLDEIARIARAEALNDEIWSCVKKEIKPGMTEKEIQRLVRAWMNELGDGEAFETIVCAGANAAECHHVPDGTVWRKGEPLLVDLGVKLDGVCSDMTRNIKAKGAGAAEYLKVYDTVLAANRAAIAAAKPGLTCAELDAVARGVIEKAGYGAAFGHALGHGVGYEIHEEPALHARARLTLAPGMVVTIEPGIYLEGKLGVRIEDLVLITPDGCEVLSRSAK